MPIALDHGLNGAETSVHALPDHAVLGLRKGTRHVEEELAGWSGCVEVLLIEVLSDTYGLKIPDTAGGPKFSSQNGSAAAPGR